MKITCIVGCIFYHFGCQRTLRPIGLLKSLVQFDIKIFKEQVSQANSFFTKQLSADHRIKQAVDVDTVVSLQAPQVIVGRMENFGDSGICQNWL